MTRSQALAIAGAANCVSASSRAERPVRHLVLEGNRKVCTGKPLADAVLADDERPSCGLCQRRATTARRVLHVTRDEATPARD